MAKNDFGSVFGFAKNCGFQFGFTKLTVVSVFCRDVPDIQSQFRMAGYPAAFYHPVPVLAQLFPETGYLNWIIVVNRCGP